LRRMMFHRTFSNNSTINLICSYRIIQWSMVTYLGSSSDDCLGVRRSRAKAN
jgi:hypothetical protein